MCLVQKTYCMLFLRLSWGGCHSLPMHLNSNTGKKKKRKANTHLTHLREENKSPRGLQQKILSFLSNRFGLIIFFFFLFFLCPVNSNVDSIGVHFVDHIQTHRLSSSILQCCPRRAWSMLGLSQWHCFRFSSTALRHRLPGDRLDWEHLITPG